MKLKIKRGDTVQVISGSEKGKTGAVLAVEPQALQIKVQGVKVMTHFDKKEGKLTKEAFFPYSKVKLVEKVASEKKKAAKKKPASKNA
jgi:large subunit ribosomal protein L24